MKIMIDKEENIKNKIDYNDNLNINKININNSNDNKELINNNNLRKDNLIKGISKLSNIFKVFLNNKNVENKNIGNNNNNNESGKKKIIYKKYAEKLKYKCNDNWIIEEKEEEQTDENGESTSIKNDTGHIEDNINIASDSNDNKSYTESNNEKEKQYIQKRI